MLIATGIAGFALAYLGTLVPRYTISEYAVCERNSGAIAWVQCYPISLIGMIICGASFLVYFL